MTTFLFWNLKKKPLQGLVANLASRHNVDVIMLAECVIPPDVLLIALNHSSQVEFDYAPGYGCDKIRIFTRFPRQLIPPILEDSRLTIRHLKLPGMVDILLSVVHFPSKTHWSSSSQTAECVQLSQSIKLAEEQIGHSRTVLVGDLNMHPFEEGIVNANGLHSIMSRRIAQKKSRTVQGREYTFFYNPMWGLLGDAASDTPGTYFQSRAEHTAYFWHMFDQVLLRPDLLQAFSNADLKILNSDGNASFLTTSGLPNEGVASDHLPILFKLRL